MAVKAKSLASMVNALYKAVFTSHLPPLLAAICAILFALHLATPISISLPLSPPPMPMPFYNVEIALSALICKPEDTLNDISSQISRGSLTPT